MGLDTLIDVTNGDIIDQDDPNTIHRVLEGDFVGRNASGAPTAGQRLGTPGIPWGTGFLDELVVGGLPVDPALVTAPPNRIVSGKTRSTSESADYLRPAGTGASFTLLATAINLKIDVTGTIAEFTADVVKLALPVAPATNNLCTVSTGASGEDITKNLGENGTVLFVSGMQSELTSRIGEFVALRNQATDELFYCYINSSTELINARRGFFFDSSGLPVPRDVLNDGNSLQLLSLGFIFAENDGATVDVSYSNPVIGADEPGSPATGDYWLDTNINVWKRYSGSAFVQINRTFAGFVVIDTADCVGTRPEDFDKAYRSDNSLSVKTESVDVIVSIPDEFLISVDNQEFDFDFCFMRWDAASDFESGVTRTKDRQYWLYITENGEPIISDKKPYDRLGFMRGWYHPYESWRAVAQIYNNSAGTSGEFSVVHSTDEQLLNYTGAPPVSTLGRVILSNNSSDPLHDIDAASGRIILDDNSNEYIAPAMTKRLDAAWSPGDGNGGNPFGSLTANTTYYYFAIASDDGSVIDYGVDLFMTAGNLLGVAGGVRKASYQGSLRTDGASDIRPFKQFNKDFVLDTPLLFESGPQLVSKTLDTNSPSGIVTKAKIAFSLDGGRLYNWAVVSMFQTITSYIEFANATGSVNKTVDLHTDTSSQIRLEEWGTASPPYNILDSNFYLLGWEDTNLKG